MAVTKDQKNGDGNGEKSPVVIVKCRSADMVSCHHFMVLYVVEQETHL